jgi:hypothetical protein
MQRIPRDLARKYAFDWRDEPLLHGAERIGHDLGIMRTCSLSQESRSKPCKPSL